MHHCPSCKSDRIHSSRTRSRWETWRKEITGKRAYRCHQCGWRGWGADSGPRFSAEQLDSASRAMAPDPPNLKETLLAREETSRKFDLGELDAAMPKRSDN
jgi:hypothetical protein